jgi:hypothetical protein
MQFNKNAIIINKNIKVKANIIYGFNNHKSIIIL